MEIARMNERITIEKNTVVVDKIGNHSQYRLLPNDKIIFVRVSGVIFRS